MKPEFMVVGLWVSLLIGSFLWFFAVGWVNCNAHKTERKVKAWNALFFLFCPLALIVYLSLFRRKKARTKGKPIRGKGSKPAKEEATVAPLSELVDGKSLAMNTVQTVIGQALDKRSTDIRLEPKNDRLFIRFRVDGLLHEGPTFPHDLGMSIISCLKVLAKIDIAERRKPQDGSFKAKVGGSEISFRLSTAASIYGESMVIRILDPERGLIGIEKLGFLPHLEERIHPLISRSQGMILVTGPAGSGKTTTLYAILSRLNTGEKSIISIEDPVEYELQNITQIPINPKAGVNFANSLRSILRHDPNIIMVGEIRDVTTAEIAVGAALTGHLVISTLHTREAAGAVTRLLDMKLEAHLISSSLIGVLAQRLIRMLCPECKVPCAPEDLEKLRKQGLKLEEGDKPYKLVGCKHCGDTGYRGRTGIFELLTIDDSMKDLMNRGASTEEIVAKSVEKGMVPMMDYGWEKVRRGVSTFDEVDRVLR